MLVGVKYRAKPDLGWLRNEESSSPAWLLPVVLVLAAIVVGGVLAWVVR
jgi:multisubunit Na+/H+ antiporter MnhC subunit